MILLDIDKMFYKYLYNKWLFKRKSLGIVFVLNCPKRAKQYK